MGCTACTEPQCLYKDALYLYLYLTNGTCYKFCEIWEHIFGSVDRDGTYGCLSFIKPLNAELTL